MAARPHLLRTAAGAAAGALIGGVAIGLGAGRAGDALGASGWTGLGIALAGGAVGGVLGGVGGCWVALAGRGARRATLVRAAAIVPVLFLALVVGGEELLGTSVGYPPPPITGLIAVVGGAVLARWLAVRAAA